MESVPLRNYVSVLSERLQYVKSLLPERFLDAE